MSIKKTHYKSQFLFRISEGSKIFDVCRRFYFLRASISEGFPMSCTFILSIKDEMILRTIMSYDEKIIIKI